MGLLRKLGPFLFGVSIGLLAGVGFFIFKINDWFTKLRDTANERITVIEQPVKTAEVPKENKPREKFRLNLKKNTKVNYHEVDSMLDSDSKITIATDELLSVKSVKLINVGDISSPGDSTAISRDEPAEPAVMQVEFWKTPLNSRGYRFSKKKLVLYGFPDFSNVLIYEMDNSFFLRSSDQVYKLVYTADFKAPERVTDPEILAKLN